MSLTFSFIWCKKKLVTTFICQLLENVNVFYALKIYYWGIAKKICFLKKITKTSNIRNVIYYCKIKLIYLKESYFYKYLRKKKYKKNYTHKL